MTTVLLDTCIIIDVLQKREPFWKDAVKLFHAAANNKIVGVVTAKSVTDISYLYHRYSHDNQATREVILKLLSLFQCADTASGDCINALHSDASHYEDAVMMETAKRIQADYIVTRNLKDYKHSQVQVILPADFLLQLDGN